MELVNGFDSNYRYILVRAKRARQLQSGASPLVATSSGKPCRIAEQEILAQKVKWSIPEPKPAVEATAEARASAPEPTSEE